MKTEWGVSSTNPDPGTVGEGGTRFVEPTNRLSNPVLRRVMALNGRLAISTASRNFCSSLAVFPNRGADRDDLRPGLRILGFERRAVIAFHIATDTVTILPILYGGVMLRPLFTDSTKRAWPDSHPGSKAPTVDRPLVSQGI